MTSTRQRILDYLKSRHIASATELANAFRLSPANLRHHLSILLAEGVIQITGIAPHVGRGRPGYLYSLMEESRGHNLDLLAHALLEELGSQSASQGKVHPVHRVAQRMVAKFAPTKASLIMRLNAAVEQLNAWHYQARWEAHAQGPNIFLGHCPYGGILPQHPELCQMDTSLLEGMLNIPVSQIAKLATDQHGHRYCQFVARLQSVRKLSEIT